MNKLEQMFLDRTNKSISYPCWIWEGVIDAQGFGRMKSNKKQYRAHRLSYSIYKEDIPSGETVLHDCSNNACVNPDHLYLEGTSEDRFWRNVNKGTDNDCWEWQGYVNIYRNGYGIFNVNGMAVSTHRFSWELHNGEIPIGKHILHSCHNPPCVNPSHLRVGDHVENMLDMRLAGRAKGIIAGNTLGKTNRGENSAHAKLTEQIVRDIRSKYVPRKYGIDKLSDEYGVSRGTVHDAIKRKTWKHII